MTDEDKEQDQGCENCTGECKGKDKKEEKKDKDSQGGPCGGCSGCHH